MSNIVFGGGARNLDPNFLRQALWSRPFPEELVKMFCEIITITAEMFFKRCCCIYNGLIMKTRGGR